MKGITKKNSKIISQSSYSSVLDSFEFTASTISPEIRPFSRSSIKSAPMNFKSSITARFFEDSPSS